MTDCPCCSGKAFNECCQPIIQNEAAPTALALMRSRYTVYHAGQSEYLYKTTHSSTRGQYKVSEIENWSKENTWTKLEIISVEHGNIKNDNGIVEFKAYFNDKNGRQKIHHERSTFLKEDGLWYYLKGEINPKEVNIMKKVSRNDPCPCGSGKKHKKCCG